MEQVGMVLDWITPPDGRIVAVLPGPLRQVQRAHGRDYLFAKHRVARLVISVPDGYARVVPIVAHPIAVLPNHFVHVPVPRVVLVPTGRAGPDEELVLNQQPRFISNFQPPVRHRPDAEPETVPVHLM